MNWYKRAEKTLYHGTIRDHADSIRQVGIVPERGDFVSDAYASEYEAAGVSFEENVAELSYAADKENISNAVTAMTHHIANKLNKTFHDVTPVDIRNHGLIVKIKGSPGEAVPPSPFEQRPEDYDQEWEMMGEERGLHAVEPSDYYSEYPTGNEASGDIELITGSALIRFLQRRGLV
tara:strand:+ start:5251 stop:5781 length:531 start_codon:yes stop_codon:yes gene_type:complete